MASELGGSSGVIVYLEPLISHFTVTLRPGYDSALSALKFVALLKLSQCVL